MTNEDQNFAHGYGGSTFDRTGTKFTPNKVGVNLKHEFDLGAITGGWSHRDAVMFTFPKEFDLPTTGMAASIDGV